MSEASLLILEAKQSEESRTVLSFSKTSSEVVMHTLDCAIFDGRDAITGEKPAASRGTVRRMHSESGGVGREGRQYVGLGNHAKGDRCPGVRDVLMEAHRTQK